MVQHCLNQKPLRPGDGPMGLVLAPTRELAQQVSGSVAALGLSSAQLAGCRLPCMDNVITSLHACYHMAGLGGHGRACIGEQVVPWLVACRVMHVIILGR